MSPSTLPAPRPPRRDPWLDAVRGVSVVAMVLGHTLDLTLDDRLRDAPFGDEHVVVDPDAEVAALELEEAEIDEQVRVEADLLPEAGGR